MEIRLFFPSRLSLIASFIILLNCIAITNAQTNKNLSIPTFDKLLKLKWKISTDNFQLGEPIYKNGIVFFTAEKDFAVDAETGKKLFFNDPVDSDVIRERVKDSIMLFSGQGYSHLINIYTGKEIENFSFHSSYPLFVSPKMFNNSAIIRYSGKKSIINYKFIERYPYVDPEWIFDSQSSIFDDYIELDSNLLIFDETDLYCVNNKNGEIIWQFTIGAPLYSNPIIDGNILYFVKKKDRLTKTLCSFNIDTKSIDWSYDFSYFKVYVKILLHEGTIFLAGTNGIYFINSSNGSQEKYIKGSFAGESLSQIDKYIIMLNQDAEGIPVPVAINMFTAELSYQRFASEGFPPITVKNMSDEAKKMKENGELGWDEGLGWNNLDGGDIFLVEDKETGLIYCNNGNYYCFEIIE